MNKIDFNKEAQFIKSIAVANGYSAEMVSHLILQKTKALFRTKAYILSETLCFSQL